MGADGHEATTVYGLVMGYFCRKPRYQVMRKIRKRVKNVLKKQMDGRIRIGYDLSLFFWGSEDIFGYYTSSELKYSHCFRGSLQDCNSCT